MSARRRYVTGFGAMSSRHSPRTTRGATSRSRDETLRECATHGWGSFVRVGGVRRLSLRPLQHRSGDRAASASQGDSRRRGRRAMRHLRVRCVRRRAPVPPPRSGDEGVRGQPSGDHALASAPPLGGPEMRATVRELPRNGRGWAAVFAGSSRPPWVVQRSTVGGSSTAEHRLLIRGLWVRIPPPELRAQSPASSRRPRGGGRIVGSRSRLPEPNREVNAKLACGRTVRRSLTSLGRRAARDPRRQARERDARRLTAAGENVVVCPTWFTATPVGHRDLAEQARTGARPRPSTSSSPRPLRRGRVVVAEQHAPPFDRGRGSRA